MFKNVYGDNSQKKDKIIVKIKFIIEKGNIFFVFMIFKQRRDDNLLGMLLKGVEIYIYVF